MSWFGDTFGDSLNSLKGQITKITKEVLAEDDSENQESDSVKSKLKELDALCASKDMEIMNLREENLKISQRFQEELKLLRNENRKLKTNCARDKDENLLFGDDQIREVCELENQLQQLKIERDHLEELQKDHQSNICLVIQQKDKYKQELEKVKGQYYELEQKYNKLLNAENDKREVSSLSDVSLAENQIKHDDSNNLKEMVDKLQIQVGSYQNEKEESSKLIESHLLNIRNLEEKIEKLTEEIKISNTEKEAIQLENHKLMDTISCMTSDLSRNLESLKSEQEKKHELEKELKELTQTLDANVVEQNNFKTNLESQMKQLVNIFFKSNLEKYSDISLSALVSEIENFWNCSLIERENTDKMYNENLAKFQSDFQKLKNDKSDLESEVKVEIDKRNELECNYKKEINSLQSKYLKLKSEEQDCIIKSQTDDVKRLNQEVSKLMEVVESKNNELSECYNKINTITQELNTLKVELLTVASEKEELEKTVVRWKSDSESKVDEMQHISKNCRIFEDKCKIMEDENKLLSKKNNSLQDQLNETLKANEELESDINSLRKLVERLTPLEKELDATVQSKSELEKICAEMQQVKLNYDNQFENLKAQLIIKESALHESNAKNKELSQELDQSRENILKLQTVEEELHKWKEAMIELEMQRQELSEQKELLENTCASLKSQYSNVNQNEAEIERLQRENANLIEVCNRLQNEIQGKNQNDALRIEDENRNDYGQEIISGLQSEIDNLKSIGQQQTNFITGLTCENNELKHHLQLANESIAGLNEEINRLRSEENGATPRETKSISNFSNQGNKEKINAVQQHKRSKSDFDTTGAEDVDIRLELDRVKETLQRQLHDYKVLQEQYTVMSDKEAHSKKELERLRLHLIEIEDYYPKAIDEYKTKLNATEEQLKNSSSFYTSNKVRDNQHLESLKSQVRLISEQRDALQEQLSAAEDQVQKHKAALTSFHVVLEQFQQDKEREFENIAAKYQNLLSISDNRLTELHQEIESLNNQLSDAKNGLKAASRLGEQLEKKSQQIADLERTLTKMQIETKELEETAKLANQSNFDKVDKSLLKNLLLGYISSQKSDRKDQVLRIMMSVLDFDDEERNRIGMDNTQSGWLSTLLHPRGDGITSSQSLSEAFIRFLENESRPQPHLKLLSERTSQLDRPRSATATPKPSLLLQELVLPTFNSPQTNESTILKDVLNDS